MTQKIIAYKDCGYRVIRPCLRGSYSVEEINNGAVAWLYHPEIGSLMGGDSLDKCIEWLENLNAKWGELHE